MDFIVNNFHFGVGVPDFHEKSSSRMKSQGAKEEKKSSLEIGYDLSFLVYLGRGKPKDLPTGRVVRLKFEESLYPITNKVVLAVFGVG